MASARRPVLLLVINAFGGSYSSDRVALLNFRLRSSEGSCLFALLFALAFVYIYCWKKSEEIDTCIAVIAVLRAEGPFWHGYAYRNVANFSFESVFCVVLVEGGNAVTAQNGTQLRSCASRIVAGRRHVLSACRDNILVQRW